MTTLTDSDLVERIAHYDKQLAQVVQWRLKILRLRLVVRQKLEAGAL